MINAQHPASSFQVVTRSLPGNQHRQEEEPCEDAHEFCFPESNLLVAAVADGAGSSGHGGAGSSTAVEAAVGYLAQTIRFAPLKSEFPWWERVMWDTLWYTRTQIQRKATECSVEPDELATTLLVVAGSPSFLVLGQIGDGGAVVQNEGENLHLLAQPHKGQYPNETLFVTSSGALQQPRIVIWPRPFEVLAMFTDGLEQLALEGLPRLMNGGGGLSPYAGFLGPVCQLGARSNDVKNPSQELATFLESPVVRDYTDDDLTLLLASTQ